jgi:hypothetical protein
MGDHNNPQGNYLSALEELETAAAKHRMVYAAQETGLASWHESCKSTWARLEQAMVAVSGEQLEQINAEDEPKKDAANVT